MSVSTDLRSIIQERSDLVFEKKSPFSNNQYPCYYKKNKNGYVAFFFPYKEESVDFGVYDNDKKPITFIVALDASLKENWRSQFVKEALIDDVVVNS